MFEKLLANLPYNPGLAKQVGFYARRMRREESIRRTGLVFIVLAFLVQFFAFISPPQSTSAYSNGDMINGGFSKQSEAVAACRNNDKNYGDALYNFGISCDDVANMQVTTIVPNQDNNQLFSMGWMSYGQNNPVTGKATDQQEYNLVRVNETLYAQRHSSFYGGSNLTASYKALEGKTDDGKTFWILFGCGNLVFVGQPVPVKPCPYNSSTVTGDKQCFKPCPVPGLSNLPAGSAQCYKPCPLPGLSNLPITSPKCVTPCPVHGLSGIPASSPKCFNPCPYNKSIPVGTAQCFPPCPYNASISKTSSQCRPCTDKLSRENPAACIVPHKSAVNVTEHKADANGTTAQANDVIVYTLFADNKGKATVNNFVMQENLSDVLDYATVIDLHGGTIDTNNEVTWPKANIKPGNTLTHQITVRVKNPIPATTPPADDPNHFDHVMTNIYGTTVNIYLPPPAGTPVVTVSQELPNTGPGSSLILAGAILVVAGYFFARSRLLVDESMVVMQETTSGGI